MLTLRRYYQIFYLKNILKYFCECNIFSFFAVKKNWILNVFWIYSNPYKAIRTQPNIKRCKNSLLIWYSCIRVQKQHTPASELSIEICTLCLLINHSLLRVWQAERHRNLYSVLRWISDQAVDIYTHVSRRIRPSAHVALVMKMKGDTVQIINHKCLSDGTKRCTPDMQKAWNWTEDEIKDDTTRKTHFHFKGWRLEEFDS